MQSTAATIEDRRTTYQRAWGNLASRLTIRRHRTLREFVEQELVVPSGPFEGARFRVDRQPVLGLWFDAVDSGRWTRFVATGPQQSGKTLGCFVAPTLYHLFELREPVIWGVYDLSMANDKWRRDLLPAIMRTRYRDLLPESGEGSRGGKVETGVAFKHGAEIRVMTRGGSDKSRAGYTSRVVVITETDGLDSASDASREADPIAQLEGRTRAYGDRARVYMECTVSIEEGRTWREYQGGTASRIALPCPHCAAWVTPEREHLTGWSDADTEIDAREHGSLLCPSCACHWTEQDRRQANAEAKLLHAGEVVEDGKVTGQAPRTRTLGFRWTAANNLLVPVAEAAAIEWRAARNPNEVAARREVLQFLWAKPYHAESATDDKLEPMDVARRQEQVAKGVIPDWATHLTVGCDVGKWLLHWVVIAWSDDARGHVVDYGRLDVPSADMAEELAVRNALRELRDTCLAGWLGPAGKPRQPELALFDSGWKPEPVYAVVEESDPRFRASKGIGASQYGTGRYRAPKTTGSTVVQIGDGYHVVRLPTKGTLVEIDVDRWKTWVSERLRAPIGQPGSLTLHQVGRPVEHLPFAKHLLAERSTQTFEPRKGTVTTWQRTSPQNHWLDATVLASVAAHALGVRAVVPSGNATAHRPKTRPAPSIRTPWSRWRR